MLKLNDEFYVRITSEDIKLYYKEKAMLIKIWNTLKNVCGKSNNSVQTACNMRGMS